MTAGGPIAGDPPVNAIVFSRDRPLQLDGLLQSIRRHVTDPYRLRLDVLYRATTSAMRNLYWSVSAEHEGVRFTREAAFRRDLRRLVPPDGFVLFLTDDSLFVDAVTIDDVIGSLAQASDALGFSLRLGRNTTYCYTKDRAQAAPNMEPGRRPQVLSFDWTDAELDFGYPLELSSSVYRAADLAGPLARLRYRNPNTLEGQLAREAARYRRSQPRLLCFEQSRVLSIPVNVVQDVSRNRAGSRSDASIDALARAYRDGQRLQVDAYAGHVARAAHEELPLQLVPTGPVRPAVSVVIPCYEQARWLGDAIESVVAQTLEEWELVVVNDGSSDATSDVARAAMARHPARRIRLLETSNQGLATARNTGIAATTGWLVLPLDADDRLHPRFLEDTVAALERHPETAIAYTDLYYVGARDAAYRLDDYSFDRLCYRNIHAYCALFRRHAWVDSGGYRPNMAWGYEDWDFWVGCGEVGAFATHVREPRFIYRYRPDSMSATTRLRARELRRRLRRNHPGLYTSWRRALRAVRHGPRLAARRVIGVASRTTGRAMDEARYRLRGRRTSITDERRYLDVCERASREDAAFSTFRSHPDYVPVLEHVTPEQGQAYLDLIRSRQPDLAERWLGGLEAADRVGGPVTFGYEGVGHVSPTSLRYTKVLADLVSLFGDLSGMRIAEIGVGYGGQCRIICDHFDVAAYTLVDLDAPLRLATRYLSEFPVTPRAEARTMRELDPEARYDLVISNYAFSELSRDVQDEYVRRVIGRSAAGYLTVNFVSAAHGIRSYTRTELLDLAPGIVIRAEEPQTHPENVILTWGP